MYASFYIHVHTHIRLHTYIHMCMCTTVVSELQRAQTYQLKQQLYLGISQYFLVYSTKINHILKPMANIRRCHSNEMIACLTDQFRIDIIVYVLFLLILLLLWVCLLIVHQFWMQGLCHYMSYSWCGFQERAASRAGRLSGGTSEHVQ